MSRRQTEQSKGGSELTPKTRGGALPKGTVLKERYHINKVLGRGGFGITYRAMDQNLQVEVAVKEVLYESEEEMKRAMKEARIAASLYDLEGIVTVRDYFVENEIAYIVMEYVHGISVKQYIVDHGRMDGKEVLNEMKPLLFSIQKIHNKGIIHRDISVDNLMITTEGKLKLIDFGAASFLSQYNEEGHTVLIKRGYAPIEQYRSEDKLGTWTDIYSLCATMYFMITGIVPQDSVERWVSDKLTSLEDVCGTGLSERQSKAIMKGMEVRQQDRFQDLAELYQELYGELEEAPCQFGMKTDYPTERTLSGHTWTFRQEVSRFLNGKSKNRYISRAFIIVCLLLVVGGGAIGLSHLLKKSVASGENVVKDQLTQASENEENAEGNLNNNTVENAKEMGSPKNRTTSEAEKTDSSSKTISVTKETGNSNKTTSVTKKTSSSNKTTTGTNQTGNSKKTSTGDKKATTSQTKQPAQRGEAKSTTPKPKASPKPYKKEEHFAGDLDALLQ